jgi:hypothetical protein
MLVVDYKAGQLANRLFQFSYFIANSIEYNYKLVNPYFEEYRHLFPCVANNSYPAGNISTNFSNNKTVAVIIKNAIRIARRFSKKNDNTFMNCVFHNIRQTNDTIHKEFDMNDPSFTKKVKHKIVFAKGWYYRDIVNLEKHATLIRKIFTPGKDDIKKVTKIISYARKNNKLAIAVHLRKGDYKNFFEGRWYYEDELYLAKMKSLEELLKLKGKQAVFIMCSNEKICPDHFSGLDIITGEHEPVTDLYCMASCDYIIGPPSTFTMWASYYGSVPLLILKNKMQQVRLNDFSVMKGIEGFY